MRPALYYPWVYLKGGAERVLVELMTRSRHDWLLYTNHYDREATFPEFKDLPIQVLNPVSVKRDVVHVARAGMTLMTQQVDFSAHDRLVVVSEGLGNLMALRSNIPTSCICLTPLKIAYDEVTRRRYFAGGGKVPQRVATMLYKQLDRLTWSKYQHVFCNSGETMRRLMTNSLVDEERLEVLYHGVDTNAFYPTGERDPYFLVAGRIMWSKNIELAVHAWQIFKPSPAQNNFRLVIAGMTDRKSRNYLTYLKELVGERSDISFVESPTDQQLVSLYQRCRAVVYTPPNEDWGLVPLEGMASGKLVIATDRGGPRESVRHGESGFLVQDMPSSFAHAMELVANMSDSELDRFAHCSREVSLNFPWSRFVDRIDEHVSNSAPILREAATTF